MKMKVREAFDKFLIGVGYLSLEDRRLVKAGVSSEDNSLIVCVTDK